MHDGMVLARRLEQASRLALGDILGDQHDSDVLEALGHLSEARALDVADTGLRAARLVARGVPRWTREDPRLGNLWRLLAERGDRAGLDALIGSLSAAQLARVLAETPGHLLSWEVVWARVAAALDDGDPTGVEVIVNSEGCDEALVRAAYARGFRDAALAAAQEGDGARLTATLVGTFPVTSELAGLMETHYMEMLARFGVVREQRVELPVAGVADSTAARALAGSAHAGLRRLAARSAQSDGLLRAGLLGDDSLLGDLCLAPLRGGEIHSLLERTRQLGSVPAEASELFYQSEPLATRDRLWILRHGGEGLVIDWIGGRTQQDPRPGEVTSLLARGVSVTGGATRLAQVAAGRRWERELVVEQIEQEVGGGVHLVQ